MDSGTPGAVDMAIPKRLAVAGNVPLVSVVNYMRL